MFWTTYFAMLAAMFTIQFIGFVVFFTIFVIDWNKTLDAITDFIIDKFAPKPKPQATYKETDNEQV